MESPGISGKAFARIGIATNMWIAGPDVKPQTREAGPGEDGLAGTEREKGRERDTSEATDASKGKF